MRSGWIRGGRSQLLWRTPVPSHEDKVRRRLRRAAPFPGLRFTVPSAACHGVRHRSVFAVIESDRWCRAILDGTPDGVICMDSRGILLYFNPGAERQFGYSSEEMVGRSIEMIVPERYRESHRRGLARYVATGERRLLGKTVEVHGVRKGGTEFPIELSIAEWREGGEIRFSAFIRDISDRKKAEESLLRRGRQLEILTAAAHSVNSVLEGPVILRTLVASAVHLVGAAAGTAGVPADGKMAFYEYYDGKNWFPVVYAFPPGCGVPGMVMRTKEPYVSNEAARDPNVVPEIREALGICNLVNIPVLDREGGLIGCFEVHNKEDRRPFDEEDVGMLKGIASAAAVALDNARLLAERSKVHGELQRLATAIEQAAEIVMITDPDGAIQYVNPAFERVTGYARAEVLGRTPGILKSGSHDESFYRSLWTCLRAGEVWKGTFINRRKSGDLYEEDAVISSVRDGSGNLINYVAVKHDVTRERELERHLATAQRMETVGTLAGGIAHDFNNLLTGISGFGEMLRTRLEGNTEAVSDLNEILRCSERAATLTRQLLTFTRKETMQPDAIDLNAVVGDLGKLIRAVLGEHIDVRVQRASGLPSILADAGQVEQVLMNLCLNARDAMPAGGTLLIETGAVSVDEEYARNNPEMRPGRFVVLVVSDSGMGMDEQSRSRAFEPFFTSKGPGKGTGLGLSVVYGIVKQHGGFIHLYSEPGRGSTFRIYFPETGSCRPAEAVKQGSPVLEGTETILLAEDDESVRAVAERVLVELGYTVFTARNGEEAVEIFRQHRGRVSLAILDLVMPKKGGKDAWAEIAGEDAGLKVLFTSGYTEDAVHESFLLVGGAPFLPKPYGPVSLARKVREVLDD